MGLRGVKPISYKSTVPTIKNDSSYNGSYNGSYGSYKGSYKQKHASEDFCA